MSNSAGLVCSGRWGQKFSPTCQPSHGDMALEWSWWRFLFGVLGATAPEAVRLYRIVTGQTAGSLPRFSPPYFGISVLCMGLGGVLAVVWGDNHPLKCLWVCVSVPVIISSSGSQLPSR